ncbi:hypothetical protein KI387_004438, partial [Taxus chinensis]
MNQAISQSVAANTRSKKRNMGEVKSSKSGNPQPSITPQGIGTQNVTPNMQSYPKPPSKPTQAPVVMTHVQEKNVLGKGQKKDNSFKIIEQMKKKNVNISMWDSLSILGQIYLLHTTMANWSSSNQPPNQQEKVFTNTVRPEGNHREQK